MPDSTPLTRFDGETLFGAVVNHYGFDIEEEADFERWLDHRRVARDATTLPEEAVQFIEARKRLSSPSQHANPSRSGGFTLSERELNPHPVPSWIKSGRHG